MEDRCVPTGSFLQTNLVADLPGMAMNTDPNLVNPWGIALSPTGPFWISDNGTGVSTLYNGSGMPFPVGMPLVVTVPPPSNMMGTMASPTGIVFNGTNDFMVSSGTMMSSRTGPAAFIFATEDGTISGWNPSVDPTHAILEVDNLNTMTGPVFKGLAMGSNMMGNFLFATDFRTGTVDVFDRNFKKTTLAGNFSDPMIPKNFAPFGIQNIGGNLFVTYAMQNMSKHDDVAGLGNGFVDVFNTNGVLLQRLASGGMLNSPWGLAMAPSNFGAASNDLLVGNFGDGHVNVFNPTTGAFIGQLSTPTGTPITIDGLWGLTFGNGGTAGSTNTLFFTAGPNGETHGLFGSLTVTAPTPTPTPMPASIFATGTDAGGGPEVKVFNAQTGALLADFFAFPSMFRGGVRVAVGDVNGDGTNDIVAAAGSGGGPEVIVFDGKTLQPIRSFFAFPSTFTGGVFVAVGDTNGDGFADIIVGADKGGGPEVKVFSGKDGSMLHDFFAFPMGFTGGVRVAAGDMDHDGIAEIFAAAGPGGGPQVTVFDGFSLQTKGSINAFPASFSGGVFVAAGDVNGDGVADIIVGAGAGGGPQVSIFDGATFTMQRSFFGLPMGFMGGVRVGVTTFGGKSAIMTSAGPGGGPQVSIFDSQSLMMMNSFFATTPMFMGGVFASGR
jgi:uncharacterized protein (TIGR03118 family)